MVDIAVLENKLKDLKIQREILGNSSCFVKKLELKTYLEFYGISYNIKFLCELIEDIKKGRGY